MERNKKCEDNKVKADFSIVTANFYCVLKIRILLLLHENVKGSDDRKKKIYNSHVYVYFILLNRQSREFFLIYLVL